MRKMMAALLMALCMVMSLLPVTALAMEPEAADDGFVALNGTEGTPVAAPVVQSGENGSTDIQLNVGGENMENDDYKIMDNAINIKRDGVVYELTGTTDRKIQIWGSNSPDPVKTFYLRLNNVTVNGGITITNNGGAKLVIEVVEGTTNTIKRVYAVDLTITGNGTLNASDLGVTQQDKTNPRLTSALYIKDTTINVSIAGNSASWNGPCVLAGTAKVTFTSSSACSPLKLGEGGGDHSLTIQDNAKLYCLQADTAAPASYVDGLDMFNSAVITVKDNGYLKAEGRDSTNEYVGSGITADGDIKVEGKGTIEATAYGAAISTWGSVTANGGKIIANGSGGSSIYADNRIEIKNAIVDVTCADGYYCIYGNNGATIDGCWLVASNEYALGGSSTSITNSVLFNGKDGKVIGEAKLLEDAEIAADMTLVVPEGTKLTVPDEMTLTNNGTMDIQGEVAKVGSGETLCGTDGGNHTMKHFPGKAATKTAEGMKEHWQCLLCGKTFLDQSGSKEVTDPAQLVIPKLADDNGNNGNNGNNGSQHVNRRYPANTGSTTAPADDGKNVTSAKTGDMGVALYAVTALLSLSGGAWMARKRK